MAPAFKQGDFFGGLRAAVEGLDQAMGGAVAPVVAAAQPAPRDTNIGGQDIPVWAFIFLFGSGILNAIFGLFGSLLAAGIGGWLGFMFFGNWLAAAIAAVVVFLFSWARCPRAVVAAAGFPPAEVVVFPREGRWLFGWWRQFRRWRFIGELVT